MSNGQTQNVTGGVGTLQVRVLARGIGSPVAGAAVRIFASDTKQLVLESQTDEQGLTPVVSLAAPPYDYAQQYGLPRPFNQYDLEVEVASFAPASVQNVQIYPDALALQSVLLVLNFEDILIPYPTLWGTFPPKIPEAEVKRLPFPTGQAVLSEPVVPETITVHAGRPEDALANNYTVGFRDYIKNVASSEIYTTWPREALKANIYAILSFTLNRVYTEWYRGKGYGFTITNSTAFDQSFTFGRTIYEEISEVVDEIFTTYIVRGEMTQPLLAQYCDGRRVIRAGWLSQWGSKELADQGFSALQILRFYYGSDISLRQARRVEGTPPSFQGELSIGSEGDGVRTIQTQLNTISNSYPLIPKLIVDGIYGARTAEAVRIFQTVFNLPPTGEVDFATWYSISNIYVAIARLA